MPSCPCNVRVKATEDWLTARKPLLMRLLYGTIIGSPNAILASQHHHFIFFGVVAALIADINCLRIDLFLCVGIGVALFEGCLCSDDEVFGHFFLSIFMLFLHAPFLGLPLHALDHGEVFLDA